MYRIMENLDRRKFLGTVGGALLSSLFPQPTAINRASILAPTRQQQIEEAVLFHNDLAGGNFAFWIKDSRVLLSTPEHKICHSDYDCLSSLANGPYANVDDALGAMNDLATLKPTDRELREAFKTLHDSGDLIVDSPEEAEELFNFAKRHANLSSTALQEEVELLQLEHTEQALRARKICDDIGIKYVDDAPYQDYQKLKERYEEKVLAREHTLRTSGTTEKFGDCPSGKVSGSKSIIAHTIPSSLHLL